ncbi:uncharacterized protein LOC105428464 [Pogonomyrmex barbatus]|uniref:Uncharacterized protein LOC105428464 n=1 Tax=Pogonomyrmex barbatus TaxID=144034 RepID=A0A8N1S8C3_9HYME|nr:uncharacterized protein LOC105428464 [Pogonomyrmex barbatus]
MAVDNPSYFSLSGGASSSTKPTTTATTATTTTTLVSPTSPRGFSALFRRRACKMGAASSQGGVLISESTSNALMLHDGRGSASGTSTPSTPIEERVPMLSRNGAIHPGCGKRRSFRNLFRSVSANADHEKTQKFLKGDPRPSDVAPPSPYLPHRSHSHSEKDRRHPGRPRRVLKSASELLSNDMVYCGLTGNSKARNDDDDNSNDDDDTAEVFFGMDDARYYNVSSTLPSTANRRRHSIGTFFGKETGASGNVVAPGRTGGPRNLLETDTMATLCVDNIDGVHCNEGKQLSSNRTRRKKHKSSSNKGSHSATALSRDGHAEDDVVFVSSKESEASNTWVIYLTACFEQISRQQGRPPFKVRHIAIEEPIALKTEEKIRSSRLQIVIVCPILLERVRLSPEHAVHLTNHLVAEKVLAMMLGVHESHINDIHRSSLISYDQWRKFFTFGFNSTDREQLDNWMVHAFQKNIPPHFNLLATPNGMVPAHKNYTSPEENPTLLHFAARFGLEKLAWQLLECPGGDLACDLRNVSELTPADLAEQAGHTRLAHQLRGYMQMNEFTNMYSYLKVISQTTNRSTGTGSTMDVPSTIASEISNEKEDYCQPRPLNEAYLVPPIARPVTTLIPNLQTTSISNTFTNNPLAANYSIVPTPTPVINNQLPSTPTTSVTSNGLDMSFQGYMKMHATDYSSSANSFHHNLIGSKPNTTNLPPSRTGTPTQNIRQECVQNPLGAREDNCSQKISSQNHLYGRTSSNSSTKSREPSGPQDELLEIINDFKNNVFTISEVERLVENWQKRNDVQQSFKDKQRQLMAMREEYDRIQKRLKEEMKTPTPFDKIRKFFSKGKKDTKSAVSESSMNKTENINSGLADCRPISSLSLRSISSSSSSGRMSTVSGCSGASLGDSGTHSDSEDRRLQNIRDEKAGMTSYEIPPAPKPFTGRYSPASGYSPSPSVSISRDLDFRHTQSSSRADNEYYIAFPPSGLPVHAFKADGSPREPDTPNSLCDHPRYHDFQNVSPDKPQEETEGIKHVASNSYTNIEPISSNFIPVVPPGMCIPDCTSNESTSADSVHVDRQVAGERHLDDTAEACSDTTKVKPSFAQPAIDEIDSALAIRGQETVGTTHDEENVSTNLSNVSRNMNEATEIRMPEYMNLAVNIGHDAAKILGAIPKKLPAPPVPPRGTERLEYQGCIYY